MQGITYQSNAIKASEASESGRKKLKNDHLRRSTKKLKDAASGQAARLSHATAVEALHLALLAQVLRMTVH